MGVPAAHLPLCHVKDLPTVIRPCLDHLWLLLPSCIHIGIECLIDFWMLHLQTVNAFCGHEIRKGGSKPFLRINEPIRVAVFYPLAGCKILGLPGSIHLLYVCAFRLRFSVLLNKALGDCREFPSCGLYVANAASYLVPGILHDFTEVYEVLACKRGIRKCRLDCVHRAGEKQPLCAQRGKIEAEVVLRVWLQGCIVAVGLIIKPHLVIADNSCHAIYGINPVRRLLNRYAGCLRKPCSILKSIRAKVAFSEGHEAVAIWCCRIFSGNGYADIFIPIRQHNINIPIANNFGILDINKGIFPACIFCAIRAFCSSLHPIKQSLLRFGQPVIGFLCRGLSF